ncbi:MAG: ankyrin repeat domain-containing protein [Acidobacteria bacterium]|nr:ankyrin repeat domain-containing protein [Acidobacteriota bacterium]
MSASMHRTAGLLVLAAALGVAAPSEAQETRVVEAAAAQDRDAVRTLIERNADVDAPWADGSTALLWAAHWNDLDMADLLLAAGADVNAADDHGVTPLERAAENTSLAMVEKLLAAGADVNAARASGLTPLMVAARTSDLPVVNLLLAHGAEVNARTVATRGTALMWAVGGSHPDVARALLNGGAEPGTSTADGFTPLLFAAANGDVPMAEALIAAGVDVNDTGTDGTHVLPYAIASGQGEFARFLLRRGANPNGAMGGIHALHVAAGNVGTWLGDWSRRHGYGGRFRGRNLPPDRRLALVQALLERGAEVDARIATSAMFMSYIGHPTKGAFEGFSTGTGDLRGATPLWVAAYAANGAGGGGALEIMRTLLAAGADQHLTTDDGTTPFMVAAGLGRATYTPREPRGVRSESAEAAVRILREAGADIDAANEADFTALHGAAYRGLNEVIEYLVAEGADIDARDFRGRTPYRIAEGTKQSFQFQSWPESAALLERLGANTRLGIPGTVQEKIRDVPAAANDQF